MSVSLCSSDLGVGELEFAVDRGDANADGGTDVSDAITILLYLFAGQAAVTCEKAADADDGGALEITDPVYLLRFLFSGGAEIPPPIACGTDPTPDPLTCDDFAGCGD